ncbi:hypothetical protein PQR05_29915 [Paraburkholderia sediminicola]|uniref:hypothetical protein n=1 Tax=Paraburkholderia sediminicola TaxID=458836 RepID=UPI0038B9F712
MFSTSRVCARVAIVLTAIGILTTSVAVRAEAPHLTLDDIDQLSRDKVVRQLKGNVDGAGGQAANTQSLTTPLPSTPEPSGSPKQPAVAASQATAARSRVEPVTFVGAYSDASGGYVLYEMGGGVYPAHLGTKLMNGWTAKKVDGFLVTVAEGKRVWTEPIRGGAAPGSATTPALQMINDLGGPLPPAGPMAAPIYVPPGK